MFTKPVDVNYSHSFKKPKVTSHISYDPLEWNLFFDRKEMMNGTVPVYIAGNQGHVFVCLHGAGHGALSFAALAKYLKTESTVVAFDFRGHGDNFND